MNRMTLDDLKKQSKDEKKNPQPKENEIILHWYKNGWIVNDGEFQDSSLPENQEFLKSMEAGKVPKSLVKEHPNIEHFSLNDRRKEMYRPPSPPKYQKFQGQGISLGVNQPGGVQSENKFDILQQQQLQKQPKTNLNAEKIKVDKNLETGQIIFILHNGEKINVEVNAITKIQELYNYISQVAPPTVGASFQLLAGFPPKVLDQKNKTVEELDILDSRVTQKLVT